MKNWLKNIIISIVLPNLVLGETAALTADAEDVRQSISTAVANNTVTGFSHHPSAPSRTTSKSKTWPRQYAVLVVSIGVAFVALCYAFTSRAANQSLAETCKQQNTELKNLSENILALRAEQKQALEAKDTELKKLEDQLSELSSRFSLLEIEKDKSVEKCEKLGELSAAQKSAWNNLDATHKELKKQYDLVQEVKESLEKIVAATTEKLKSYESRQQALKDQEVSLEEQTKELQLRLDAVQVREQQSQERLKVLEGREKAITQQDAEIESHLQALKIEKTQLESQASIFAKLISETRDLKIELERKERTVNEQIEKSPQLQEVLTKKQKLECSLFSTMGIKEKGGVTLGFPAEIILNIMSFCDKKTLLSLFLTNKETNQSVQSFINTSPSIFFKKFYPSFISLEVKPVKIFAVPPLDQNLFKEPTPLKLLQSLPKVFKHKLNDRIYGMLPLPYAKAFLEFLQLVAIKNPQLQTIFESYPLPIWIGPVMTPFQTDIQLSEDDNIKAYSQACQKAAEATVPLIKGTGTLIQQHPHVIVRTPKDYSLMNPDDYDNDNPNACLLRTFLEEFLQPYAIEETPSGQNFTRRTSFDSRIYDAIIGYGPGPAGLYAQIHTLCTTTPGKETQQSALQTIHTRSYKINYATKKIPLICKEIVLEDLKSASEPWEMAIYDLKYMLGIRISGSNLDGRAPIPHNVETLRLLNFCFDQNNLERLVFCGQNIPNLIIHVPEKGQLTEDVKAVLQKYLNDLKTLKSIEIRTAYNGIDWHQSQPLGQFSKTSESSQKS